IKYGQTFSHNPRGGHRRMTRYMEDVSIYALLWILSANSIAQSLFLYLLETPNAYQDKIRWFIFDEFGVVVSERSLYRVFKKRRWSRKMMTQRALQQSMPLRADWIARIRGYLKEQFVFLDESACNSRMMDRKYGWSAIGAPAL